MREQMQPSRVLEYVLKDHADLRARLDRVESELESVSTGARQRVKPLLEEAEALLDELLVHMRWEDVHLAKALREADAWGPEREERLRREHREQRELLRQVVEELRGPARADPTLLTRKIGDFVSLVRADMEEEEFSVLDPNVLRDDVVGIDVEGG